MPVGLVRTAGEEDSDVGGFGRQDVEHAEKRFVADEPEIRWRQEAAFDDLAVARH